MKKLIHFIAVTAIVLAALHERTLAQGQYIDFQNATYYTAIGNALTSSGQSLASFNFSTALPTHPLKNNGVFFKAIDYLGNNLWLRVQHIQSDPNGTGVGHNVTATANSPFRLGGFGGWFGFLYKFEIYQDINLTGAFGNTLNGLTDVSVLVESLETLSSPEWEMLEIPNSNPLSYWKLNSINFTGLNAASNPHYSAVNVPYTGSFSPTYPVAPKNLYTIDGPGGSFSEFRVSANALSTFNFGYEYNWSGGYQGIRLEIGIEPSYGSCVSSSVPPATVTSNAAGNTACLNIPVTLTANGGTLGSGGSYKWYEGNCGAGVALGSNSTLTLTPTVGSHTYFVRIEDSCSYSTCIPITINVTANPTVGITVSPSSTVCFGATVTLSGTGASTYSWTGGISNGVAFTPAVTGSYTVTGTSGGCTSTATQTITVNALPNVSVAALPSANICTGTSVTLTATGNAVSYSWTGGLTNGVAFTPVTSAEYTVTGTASNGCTRSVAQAVFVSQPVSSVSISGVTSICENTTSQLTGAYSPYSLTAVGGTITTSGSNTIHKFTSSGSLITPVGFNLNAQVLVVGGGGGGATRHGGGGGAGGFVYNPSVSLSTQVYNVTVGSGGVGGVYSGGGSGAGGNGGNSSFPGVTTAIGGGGGRTYDCCGGTGGSGGGGAGASGANIPGLAGTVGQGNNGGNGGSNPSGGGGGGAGAAGSNVVANNGGAGGVGLSNSITGVPVFYAGGGGGGGESGLLGGVGGNGGGGHGGDNGTSINQTAGTNGLGGGGGASRGLSGQVGSSGGSGVVIISYPTTAGTGTESWSSNNTSVATVDPFTGLVTGVSVGTANITFTFVTVAGCAASAVQQVTVNPVDTSITAASVCSNDLPYLWNGNNYSISGSYFINFTSASGCDSVAALNLVVKQTSTSTSSATVCDNTLPYVWNNTNYFTTGNYTINLTNAAGCDSVATLNLTVNQISTAPTSITNNAIVLNEICLGNNMALTVQGGTLGSGASFNWYEGGCGSGTSIGTGTTINITPVTGGIHQYFVRAEGSCNNTLCVSTSVTVKTTAPLSNVVVPPIIGLPVHACNGQINTISVPSVNNASQYIWDGPTGTTFNGGNNPAILTSPTASITFGNPNGSGYYIGVQAANACGSSIRKSQWVRGLTSVPLAITGNTTVCENSGPFAYTIPSTVGATSYLWTITGDASINGAGNSVVTTSLSVNVTYGSAWTGGTLCVASQTPCYTSAFKCLNLTRAASPLSQINGNTIACPGQTLTYLVTPVNGAATYVWTLPPGCTGSSSTNSISVNFGPTFIGGNIKVHVTSICGVSSADVSFTINSGVPARPSSITGPTTGLCGQTIVYTCPTQSGVTFTWTVPAGATINSGQGSNAISVTFGSSPFTAALSVTSGNGCGTSLPRSITVKGAPNAPGAITAIPSTWCANEPGIEFGVDVSALSGSYTLSWLYPNSSIAQYVLGGGNSTSLIMNWLTGTGPVHVTASNACGNATRTSTWASSCREENATELPASSLLFTAYPNPSTGIVTLEFIATEKENTIITVTDVSGRVVAKQNVLTAQGLNKMQFDLSYFAKGIYIVLANSATTTGKLKIVLE